MSDKMRPVLHRYCSVSTPGPVMSPRGTLGLELFLHTDSENVYSGFKGRYVLKYLVAKVGTKL